MHCLTIQYNPRLTRLTLFFSFPTAGVYDAAGNIGKNTKIFLNGEKLAVKGFSDYVDLYLDGRENAPKIYEKVNDRWEVCVTISDTGNFQQCSFVNGICTMKGTALGLSPNPTTVCPYKTDTFFSRRRRHARQRGGG